MRIQMNDSRERKYEALVEATGESAKSKALDRAAMFYIEMAGGTDAVPSGAFAELLRAAEERGNLTGEEIVDILDTNELPLRYRSEWSVGEE
ncbi:hypothetical protein [Halobaculum sp. D14]|uniref:hypothetical protein n=1 Tax=Halobaculum sp. D14 TaxID=3421642 RepID=UPI003EBC3173